MMGETQRLITLRDKLVLMHDEAREQCGDNDREWEDRGMAGEAQDSEQAEESGNLYGRAEALAEVIELVVEEIVIADRGGL
jgi:hypothetical protein